jgi:hypothetical protein
VPTIDYIRTSTTVTGKPGLVVREVSFASAASDGALTLNGGVR